LAHAGGQNFSPRPLAPRTACGSGGFPRAKGVSAPNDAETP